MEDGTLFIVVFYSTIYIFLCTLLVIYELNNQYNRLIRYAFT